MEPKVFLCTAWIGLLATACGNAATAADGTLASGAQADAAADAPSDGTAVDGAAQDGGTERVSCSGFSTPFEAWTVPDTAYYTVGAGYNSVTPYWTTLDLDGDGKPDLVRTSDANLKSLGTTGAASWAFFKNTGSGFAPATNWSVPDTAYYAVGAGYNSITPYWTTLDLDGDGKPDLVRTSDANLKSLGTTGAASWAFFKNTGSGFAPATNWSVPDTAYYAVGAGYNSITPYWTTLDLDGDGKPDLVRTSDANLKSLGTAGAASWAFFKNTGSGFAPATNWSVPDTAYYAVGAGYNSITPYWTTLDLDGDGKPDLVRTSDANLKSLGTTGAASWAFFKNTGSGFAPATNWSVPDTAYYAVGAGYNSITPYWTTLDLDGDGKPDLVRTSDANLKSLGTTGAASWAFFKNTGSGFAPATNWSVPDTAYYAVGAGYNSNTPYWTTADLNGDHCPDLVATSGGGLLSYGATATPQWHLFQGH